MPTIRGRDGRSILVEEFFAIPEVDPLIIQLCRLVLDQHDQIKDLKQDLELTESRYAYGYNQVKIQKELKCPNNQ